MPRWVVALVVLALVLVVAWVTRARWIGALAGTLPAAPQPELPEGGSTALPVTPPPPDTSPPTTGIRSVSGALRGALGAR